MTPSVLSALVGALEELAADYHVVAHDEFRDDWRMCGGPNCQRIRTLLASPAVRQAMGQEAGEREAAIAKVIEGFEVGVFVRDISRDHETGWAVRLLPYIAALGKLVTPEGPRGAAERREGDSDGPLRGGEAGTA